MKRKGFTLVELLVVIAILGLLVSMAAPEFGKYIDRSRSVVCMNNLRQVGIGVLNYVGDNDNTYPIIEPNPESPVYDPEVEAQPLLEELGPYGVSEAVLKCPVDLKGANAGGKVYFTERGTSYQWRPIVDEENATAPKIYGGRRGGVRVVKPSRVLICTDFETIHFRRFNRLYADGSVRAQLTDN